MIYTLLTAFFACATWSSGQEVDMSGCYNHQPFPLVIDAVNNPVGDIYTPGFREGVFLRNAICEYVIKGRPGYVIKLIFKELDMVPTNACQNDKVFVMDGPSERSPDLGVYCGHEPPLFPIVSTNNSMLVRFQKHSIDQQMRGFHVRYDAILPSEICPRGQQKCRNNRCYRPEQKCNGKDDCFDGSDEENCNLPSLSYKCGISTIYPIESSEAGMDRIVGGIEARPHSWPWQVDMQMELFYPNNHKCGATLINPQWIMTAGHCVEGTYPRNLRIHLGNHNRFKRDKYEQVRLVEKIVMWPGVTGDQALQQHFDQNHDIALIKLNAPVEITEGVRPACLPPKGYIEEIGTKCAVTGWGETRGSGSSHALKQAELFVQTDDYCSQAGERKYHICLDSRGTPAGICMGDSGGPLACKINDKYHVLGIASYVSRGNMMTGLCAVGGLSVYNRVSNKIDWIENMLRRFN